MDQEKIEDARDEQQTERHKQAVRQRIRDETLAGMARLAPTVPVRFADPVLTDDKIDW